VNLTGTLNNAGSTLILNDTTGSWRLRGGTIVGGVVTTAGDARLIGTDFSGILDAVTYDGVLDLATETGFLGVRNGLTLNGTANLGNANGTTNGQIIFIGNSTLAGTGRVVMTTGNFGPESFNQTLTLGPNLTVQAGNGTLGAGGSTTEIRNSLSVDRGMLNAASLFVSDMGRLAVHPQGTISIIGNLLGNTRNRDLFAPLGTTWFQGAGTSGNPQLLELMGRDLGNVAAGFSDNFNYGTITLGNTYLRLVDHSDNSDGPEAAYVNSLVVPAGSTLDLNGFHLYARNAQVNGAVLNGTITQLPDSGPISFGIPTAGSLALAGELDEWTFFGRAGRSLTVIVNPGGGNPPAPVSPRLEWTEVRLVGPAGNTLASASSSQAGALAALLNVALPSDGVYRIQVSAPAGQAGRTGNYVVTAWDSAPDVLPLNLNQQVTGRIETPFGVDRWKFAAVAGQQIRFDTVNTSAAGLLFRLTGPDGNALFDDRAGDSDLITLSASGEYNLTAYSHLGSSGDYAFRMSQTSQTELTLGTAFQGTLAGSGQAQLLRVHVSEAGPLRVDLDDSSPANHNELYVQFGSPPTRSEYAFRSETPLAPDQSIVVPVAAPGDWYILVYGEAVPQASSFTLVASTTAISLTGVTPDRLGDSTESVLTLAGAGFNGVSAVELVAAGTGMAFPAATFDIPSPAQLTARFAAHFVPPGVYSVRVRKADGSSAELTNAFRVTAGGAPKLETRLILPDALPVHNIPAELYVEYANRGDVAMPAPVLVLRASDRAYMTLDRSLLVGGFESPVRPDGYGDTVQILASGDTPGLLQPGEVVRVPVYWAGVAWPPEPNPVNFQLTVSTVNQTDLIDWNALRDELRPTHIGPEVWAPIFANLVAQVGTTWGDYVRMLNDNAAHLGRVGQRLYNVSGLFAFE
jgi:hypothetical protein